MKRGPKPKGQVSTNWSSDFAYVIGLITADGCLLNDGRHIDFTSKDREQVATFKKCLKLKAKIGIKHSGIGNEYYRIQFGDVLFYAFLVSIGLSPAKSKTISHVLVPDEYFLDFLRGYFDGDGTSYSFYDSIFPKSYRFYISFMSASPVYIHWLRKKISDFLHIQGHLDRSGNKPYIQLKFSKKEAVILAKGMYYSSGIPWLTRKHLKIQRSLRIIEAGRGGEIGKHAAFRTQFSQGVGSSSLPRGTSKFAH
ncbi:MAG: Uncharacterized protein G01um10148_252 [Parcubacteria group bacterium Gr01-1014_8]|nr:MAG: Uncharacterized protein G01um10148_252 [Parcubacteria group bacterium Gr01-1014_8]